jgi:acetyl-CoA C-acetyltransferase
VLVEPTMALVDKAGGEIAHRRVALSSDEGNRPGTTCRGLGALKVVCASGTVPEPAVGRPPPCVVMEADEAARRGLAPLGCYVGMAAAKTAPEEMGVGVVPGGPSSRSVSVCGHRTSPFEN